MQMSLLPDEALVPGPKVWILARQETENPVL